MRLPACPPRTHNPLLWIQGDSYPRPPSWPSAFASCLHKDAFIYVCMCREEHVEFFFLRVGWGEISRGIWGRWIWMGTLLSESAADREVNSSWPREGRSGGRWRDVVDACTGIHLKPTLPHLHPPIIHAWSLRTICHYFSVNFLAQSCGFELDSIINAQKLWVCKSDFWLRTFPFRSMKAAFLRGGKTVTFQALPPWWQWSVLHPLCLSTLPNSKHLLFPSENSIRSPFVFLPFLFLPTDLVTLRRLPTWRPQPDTAGVSHRVSRIISVCFVCMCAGV